MTAQSQQATYVDAEKIVRVPGRSLEAGRMTGSGIGFTYDEQLDTMWILDKADVKFAAEGNAGGSTRIVAARAGSNPMSTSSTRMRLRISRPAPTRSTQANAISDTTSALRTQAGRGLRSTRGSRPSTRSCSDRARRLQRRRETEDEAGHDRERQREAERGRVACGRRAAAGC